MDENKGYGGDHDKGEISVGAIYKFVAFTVALVMVALGLMWLLFDRFAIREDRRDPARPPMASSNPRKQPPEPRLESDPVMSLQQFRAAEEEGLRSYGWVDAQKGIVRIPVDRALELVAREGLPSRKGAAK